MAAKQLIADRLSLYLPKLEARVVKPGFNGRLVERSRLLRSGECVRLSNVRIEQSLGAIRPDLIVATEGGEILVEIARTSFVTDEKLKKIKTTGIPTIEFDVSGLQHLSFKDLEMILFGPTEFSNWIWHPELSTALLELTALVDAEVAQEWSMWASAQERADRIDDDLVLVTHLQQSYVKTASPNKKNASHIEQRSRLEAFARSSTDEKTQFALDSMGAAGSRVQELLPLRVIGGQKILGSPLAWQASVFAMFVHRAMKRSELVIDAETVRLWIKERFGVSDEKDLGVGVWYFLRGLEDCGILHRKVRQEFIVLAPDLLGALAIARDKKAGESKPLKWVDSESSWPSREKSTAVATAFAAAYGDASGWERIAGLLPSVRTREIPEETVRYYSGFSRALSSARVRRFLVVNGFVELI